MDPYHLFSLLMLDCFRWAAALSPLGRINDTRQRGQVPWPRQWKLKWHSFIRCYSCDGNSLLVLRGTASSTVIIGRPKKTSSHTQCCALLLHCATPLWLQPTIQTKAGRLPSHILPSASEEILSRALYPCHRPWPTSAACMGTFKTARPLIHERKNVTCTAYRTVQLFCSPS